MATRGSSVEQNTGRHADSLFYRGAGPLAAILLGVFLIPLRGVTTAANLPHRGRR